LQVFEYSSTCEQEKQRRVSTNHGRTDPAHRRLYGIFMRQDPLLNGHVAALIMPVAMSMAYSCGRGLQKISVANAVPPVLSNHSDENRICEGGRELNGATATGGDKESRLKNSF